MTQEMAPQDYLSYVQKTLQAAEQTAHKLPSYILKKEGETDYLSLLHTLKTLQEWFRYFEAKPSTPLTQLEVEQLRTLHLLRQQVETRLLSCLPLLVKQRKTRYKKVKEALEQALATLHIQMQKRNLPLSTASCALKENASQIAADIEAHLDGWNTQVLQEGRDLLVTDPSLVCPLLVCASGMCYLFLDTPEDLVAQGLDKVVFRALALPSAEIQALIKPHDAAAAASSWTASAYAIGQLIHMWTESEILLRLRHAVGIVPLNARTAFALKGGETQLFLLEDYYWDGNLVNYFQQTIIDAQIDKRFSEKNIQSIISQLLEGVRAIHHLDIIHHDIKPDNVLVNRSEEGPRVALADFHLAAYTHNTARLRHVSYPLRWGPPEFHNNISSMDRKLGDIWGLGLIFLMLVTHTIPAWISSSMKDQDVMHCVLSLPENWLPQELKGSPYRPLLEKMLAIDPLKRSSIDQALHIWKAMQKGDDC